jgi:hypothetical protein
LATKSKLSAYAQPLDASSIGLGNKTILQEVQRLKQGNKGSASISIDFKYI